ncbi:hypothetical protein BH23CHL5_BH23CHL5_19530 [soil metagenome]
MSAASTALSADLSEGPLPRLAHLLIPLTPLIGRDAECREVHGLLTTGDSRILTLTGPGGVGKTRLATEAANALRDTFPDGIAFVDLAPVSTSDLVMPAIARAIGVREGDDGFDLHRLADLIGTRHMLLVLDIWSIFWSRSGTLLACLPDARTSPFWRPAGWHCA